jgi:adenylate kinase family enzyme
MNKLLSYVEFNNWEKLEENFALVTELNYCTLLSKSIKYHSKECFDQLIEHPKIKEYLNNLQEMHKISIVFVNYNMAPNTSNEYYINKILPHLAILSFYSVRCIVSNLKLFSMFISKFKLTKPIVEALFIEIIKFKNIDVFRMFFNYIKSKSENYSFFSDNFVNSVILYCGLLFDNVDVLKELDLMGYDLTNINDRQMSTLILGLKHFVCNRTALCFEFLVNKNITTTQNLLWSLGISTYICHTIKDYMLENAWTTDNHNLQDQQNNLDDNEYILTNEHLRPILGNGCAGKDWMQIARIYTYLIGLAKSVAGVKNLLIATNQVQDLHVVNTIIKSMCLTINNKIVMHRRRRAYQNEKTIKNSILLFINQTLNIIKYFKTNKITNFNPLTSIDNYLEVKNNKIIYQYIVMYLLKLEFEVTDNTKKKVINKLFNKNELKNLNTVLQKTKLKDIEKNIKVYIKKSWKAPCAYKQSRRRPNVTNVNAEVVVPNNVNETESDTDVSENNIEI